MSLGSKIYHSHFEQEEGEQSLQKQAEYFQTNGSYFSVNKYAIIVQKVFCLTLKPHQLRDINCQNTS